MTKSNKLSKGPKGGASKTKPTAKGKKADKAFNYSQPAIINGVQRAEIQLPANTYYTFEAGSNLPVSKKILSARFGSTRREYEENSTADSKELATKVEYSLDINLMNLMEFKPGEGSENVLACKREIIFSSTDPKETAKFCVVATDQKEGQAVQEFSKGPKVELKYERNDPRDKDKVEYPINDTVLLPSYNVTSDKPFYAKVYVSLMKEATPVSTGIKTRTKFKTYQDCQSTEK